MAIARKVNAIIKVNTGNIKWVPGYDGVFGELILDAGGQKPDARSNVKDRKQKTLEDY